VIWICGANFVWRETTDGTHARVAAPLDSRLVVSISFFIGMTRDFCSIVTMASSLLAGHAMWCSRYE
jgi:hypothetical protein